jgi:hypothetical protein
MLEETLERLNRAKNSYEELGTQCGALINAIEAAIAHADLAINQNRETADLAGIAFNVRGGMAGGGSEIGAASQRLVSTLANVRSMLSSAKLTAEQTPAIAQGQADTISAFAGRLQG